MSSKNKKSKVKVVAEPAPDVIVDIDDLLSGIRSAIPLRVQNEEAKVIEQYVNPSISNEEKKNTKKNAKKIVRKIEKKVEEKDEKEGKEEKHEEKKQEKIKVSSYFFSDPTEEKKPIYDKEKLVHITIKQAIDRGIIKNFKTESYPDWRFKLPKDTLLVYFAKKKEYKLLTEPEIVILLHNSEIQPNNIHGYFFVKTKKLEAKIGQAIEEDDDVDVIVNSYIEGQKNTQEYVTTQPVEFLKTKFPQHERWKYIRSMEGGDTIKYVLTDDEKEGGPGSKYALYNFLKSKNIVGRGVFFVARNGRIIFETEINIKPPADSEHGGSDLTQWWKGGGILVGQIDSERRVWNTYDDSKFDRQKLVDFAYSDRDRDMQAIIDGDTTFYFSYDLSLDIQKIYQTFRDNENTTCFFDGVEAFCNSKIKNDINPKAFQTVLNKIKRWKKKLPDGVPEEKMQEIVDNLGVNVQINNILENEYLNFKTTNLKSKLKTTIKFINTRCDHLEFNEFNNTSNEIIVADEEKLIDVLNDHIKNNKWFYYLGSRREPRAVITSNGKYTYTDLENETIKKFNKDNNLYDYAIDVKLEKEKVKFIKKGVNYSSHCAFEKLRKLNPKLVEKDDEYRDIDIIKAYSQFKQSEFYIGFPTHMTPVLKLKNWTVEMCRKYVGYYWVLIENAKTKNAKLILAELGMKETGEYGLTSPEILFLSKYAKIDFTFFEGCYSISAMDFDLSEEMKDNKKYYRKWAGKLNRIEDKKTLKSICDEKTARTLRHQYGDNISISRYFSDKEKKGQVELTDKVEIRVEFEKDNVTWMGHIGGFVTAYTRILVLNELFKIDHSKIIGYKLDGFIIKGRDKRLEALCEKGTLWQDKTAEKKVDFQWGFKIFDDSQFNMNKIVQSSSKWSLKFDRDIFSDRLLLFSGAGGCGKTHYILSQLRDTLYVALPWKLCVEKMIEYPGVKAISLHQLLGINCESYLEKHKVPARIFVDEITQIDKGLIVRIMEHKKLKHTQIIFSGDIDKYGNYFQCSFKDVNVIDKEIIDKLKFFEFTINYRCKDERLLKILTDLRKVMLISNFNTKEITKYTLKVLKDRIVEEKDLVINYDYKTCWVLCSTTNDRFDFFEDEDVINKSQTNHYTELLKDKGRKLLCVKHSKEDIYKKSQQVKNVFLKGEILYDIEENSKYKFRHAFTIHSFQGITIKKPDKLYIDTKKIFCPRQLYTALSRVEHLDQIYLLH